MRVCIVHGREEGPTICVSNMCIVEEGPLVCGMVEHYVCQMSTIVTMLSRINPMLTNAF